jgi:hypothetical protein
VLVLCPKSFLAQLFVVAFYVDATICLCIGGGISLLGVSLVLSPLALCKSKLEVLD